MLKTMIMDIVERVTADQSENIYEFTEHCKQVLNRPKQDKTVCFQ